MTAVSDEAEGQAEEAAGSGLLEDRDIRRFRLFGCAIP